MPPEISYVSRETNRALQSYAELLVKWQEKINLISPNTVQDLWRRHMVDSAQILKILPEEAVLYDLGSGAGFPGMVIALSRPDISVTLVESDTKKCAFLRSVSRETGVTVTIENRRIEQAALDLGPPDVVTARALANLHNLFGLITPWIEKRPDLTAIFLKGAEWKQEIEDTKKDGWSFEVEDFPSETDKKARILRLKNIRKNKE